MPIILDPISPPAPPAGPPIASLPATPSVAMIEVELARRCGPFMLLYADPQSPTISTPSYAVVPQLRTQIDQDLVTNLYLLRRGVLADGTPTPEPIPSYDRVRTVYSVDAVSGRVEPDRAWQVSPYPSEQIEAHHLNPDTELFPAVQAGLRRCIFEDRLQMPPGYYYEWDVTDALPYITDQQQIRRAQVGPYPSGWPGWWRGPLELPFAAYGEGSHIWMRISGSVYWGPFWGGVLLTVHRSHFTFVNGLDQPSGPTLDTDVMSVDIDWIVSAAHIEAWLRNSARMQSAAATGLQPTQQMAAAEFQRQGFLHRLPIYDNIQFDRTELWSLGGGNYQDATYRGSRMVVNS
jgi:hypothetical protein